MHLSFGLETRPTSNRWEDIRRGPSLTEVRAHTRKLGLYNVLASERMAAGR